MFLGDLKDLVILAQVMPACRCRRLPGKCRLWCPAGWLLPAVASGNVAAWLTRMASMAELFLFIRCGDRDAGGLHRELHLPRLGHVSRSTSCSSSRWASRSSWCLAALCHSARGLRSGWLGVVGVFVESFFPDAEFFVFFGLECSGGVR